MSRLRVVSLPLDSIIHSDSSFNSERIGRADGLSTIADAPPSVVLQSTRASEVVVIRSRMGILKLRNWLFG